MEHEMGSSESPEIHSEELKQRELEILKQKIERAKSDPEKPFNPEKPEDRPNSWLSPLEQRLFHATFEGCGFHPNLAIGLVGGSSLDSINKARELDNIQRTKVPANIYVKPMHGLALALQIKLKPLTNEVVSSNNPVETFEIVGISNILGEAITGEEVIKSARLALEKRITELQAQAIQELEKAEKLPQAA